MDGEAKLNEVKKMLANLDNAPLSPTAIQDAMRAIGLLADAMSCLPEWVWDNENRCCPPGESCCMCG